VFSANKQLESMLKKESSHLFFIVLLFAHVQICVDVDPSKIKYTLKLDFPSKRFK